VVIDWLVLTFESRHKLQKELTNPEISDYQKSTHNIVADVCNK